MASSQKPAPKSGSRWNFLSQAVASVESRLDTILSEDDVQSKKPGPQQALKENIPPSRSSNESARPSTSTNDRLQERLARAMAKKAATRPDSPATSEPISRTSTPVISSISPALNPSDEVVDGVLSKTAGDEVEISASKDTSSVPERNAGPPQEITQVSQATTVSVEPSPGEETIQKASRDSARPSHSQDQEGPRASEESDALLLQAQLEHEDVRTKMQEEIDGYIERIDTLNSKLQYLTKEAASSAKQSASDSQPGSLERTILEKDEKIALLMEEGQRLSMTEMKHLTTIKKLRVQANNSNKDQEAVRKRAERAEGTLSTLDEKVRQMEAASKRAEQKLTEGLRTTQDLEAVTKERNALNDTLVEMRAQVAKANMRAETAESKAQSDRLEVERKRVVELQDDLSSAKVEREISEGKLRQELSNLRSKLEAEKEQSRLMETEMLAEQASLESRLEAFRVRAEEASSNDQGDTQAKLLRQIETLQSQYAAASQNWQGIEGTLLARITNLETERNDLSGRETDLRKKLREAVSKSKSNEKAFEEIQSQYLTLQEVQSDAQAESERIARRSQQLEEELARIGRENEEQKIRTEKDFARRLDEEKARWAASIQLTKIDSPSTSTMRKTSGYDNNHLMHPSHPGRSMSRQSSALVSPNIGGESYSPSRHHSTSSFKFYNGAPPETPSIVTSMDQEEYFSGLPTTPASPDPTLSRRGLGDLISTSTVGTGPSVQLVERMSANVRRLESEKAASKDELGRLTTQRDESRQEVVRLMREVEQKRKVEQRLKELEDEHKVLSGRYQTTLEMLGEKSEQVEELKADVQDVKQMYRELADHMK